MKHYRISTSINSKIVGHYPQIESAEYSLGWKHDPVFIDNIHFQSTDNPTLANGILHRKAKITDLISTVPAGFSLKLLVSERLKEILESYCQGNFQFFSTCIKRETSTFSYWLVSPAVSTLHLINFKKSETVIRVSKSEGGSELKALKIVDKNEFIKEKEKYEAHGTIFFINRLILEEGANDHFFALNPVEGGTGFYVSEELKNKIVSDGITGIEFRSIELTFNEWLSSGQRYLQYGTPG